MWGLGRYGSLDWTFRIASGVLDDIRNEVYELCLPVNYYLAYISLELERCLTSEVVKALVSLEFLKSAVALLQARKKYCGKNVLFVTKTPQCPR